MKICVECFDEIHSFDSYIGKIEADRHDTYVYFFNIGVSKHLLNPDDEMKYVDRAILVFQNVLTIIENYETEVVKEGFKVYYFGGLDLKFKVHKEFQVVCEKAYLNIPDDFRISKNMWDPYIMNNDVVNSFLEGK
ncbi:hypothetical protein FAZ15_01365 [Sphingobacterium olei]|uniref:Uncharacterized protein n=1 Tax=Sphingobacterium olei TaxID=2571155 RepID=A0A4U0P6A0_9SPHI|nr:hypothetical protein [Sphingobacterium olei]TJZ62976.1 hypothetical protein FAZ15_01365 [Sphingobacterium olei]